MELQLIDNTDYTKSNEAVYFLYVSYCGAKCYVSEFFRYFRDIALIKIPSNLKPTDLFLWICNNVQEIDNLNKAAKSYKYGNDSFGLEDLLNKFKSKFSRDSKFFKSDNH